jgi:ribosome-binding protein aMBF1 (putative translation factor)
MSHQDWKPIILNENTGPIKKTIQEKPKLTNLNSGVKINIDESGEETIKIKTVPKEISNLIVNARLIKKLTRKQLANNLNLREDVISDIETGKAIYDGNQIAKIKKFLCVV